MHCHAEHGARSARSRSIIKVGPATLGGVGLPWLPSIPPADSDAPARRASQPLHAVGNAPVDPVRTASSSCGNSQRLATLQVDVACRVQWPVLFLAIKGTCPSTRWHALSGASGAQPPFQPPSMSAPAPGDRSCRTHLASPLTEQGRRRCSTPAGKAPQHGRKSQWRSRAADNGSRSPGLHSIPRLRFARHATARRRIFSDLDSAEQRVDRRQSVRGARVRVGRRVLDRP
jgi:hypothetical protein